MTEAEKYHYRDIDNQASSRRPQKVFGIFFAHDYVICAEKNIGSYDFIGSVSDVDVVREDLSHISTGNFNEDIEIAADFIGRRSGFSDIRAICMAVPTPFDANNNVSRLCQDKTWRGRNPTSELAAALSERGITPSFERRGGIYLIGKSESVACGEFYSRFYRTSSFPGMHIRDIGLFLSIVIDWDIGGALVFRRKNSDYILNGERSMQFGHMKVNPFGADRSCFCSVHTGRHCLNALASLSALGMERSFDPREGRTLIGDDILNKSAYYIAQSLVEFIVLFSPKYISIGGRLAQVDGFLSLLRRHCEEAMGRGGGIASFLDYPQLHRLDSLISLQTDRHAGVKGALRVAMERAVDGDAARILYPDDPRR